MHGGARVLIQDSAGRVRRPPQYGTSGHFEAGTRCPDARAGCREIDLSCGGDEITSGNVQYESEYRLPPPTPCTVKIMKHDVQTQDVDTSIICVRLFVIITTTAQKEIMY